MRAFPIWAGLCLATFASPVAAADYDPAPWLVDLAAFERAIDQKYANLDWLKEDRGVNPADLYRDAAYRIRRANDDAAAKAALAQLAMRFRDGHVELSWPSAPDSHDESDAPSICDDLGYADHGDQPGPSAQLAGYAALKGDDTNIFDAGTVTVAGHKLGVVRIAAFTSQIHPGLCTAALKKLKLKPSDACDDACGDRIFYVTHDALTAQFSRRLNALKAAGAETLLVDISDNGGGSQWAEAAARMLSASMLTSERLGFVRGRHWAKHWSEIGDDLREGLKSASPETADRLKAWIAEADAARAEAERHCVGAACPRIAVAGYSTGLVGAAPAKAFAGMPWGSSIFSPAGFDYEDGVWNATLIVLVNQESWSAAEEFAALLQDNKAAVILGARTGGAGCGHTNGGTPTTLPKSGATLKVPDCIRFRADGSNEVRGVIPDILIGVKATDGPHLKAKMIEAALPAAIEKARALKR